MKTTLFLYCRNKGKHTATKYPGLFCGISLQKVISNSINIYFYNKNNNNKTENNSGNNNHNNRYISFI